MWPIRKGRRPNIVHMCEVCGQEFECSRKKRNHKRTHKKQKIKIVSVLSQECAATRTLVQKVMTTNLG